jgi:hypothetical protein
MAYEREQRFRSMSFWWDDPESGERYSVDARVAWPDEPDGPLVGPRIRIRRIFDLRGNDVTEILFGTFESFAIRQQAEELLEAVG